MAMRIAARAFIGRLAKWDGDCPMGIGGERHESA
jgi:hypothetical protein